MFEKNDVKLTLTVNETVYNWLKSTGNASASVRALVEQEMRKEDAKRASRAIAKKLIDEGVVIEGTLSAERVSQGILKDNCQLGYLIENDNAADDSDAS